MPWSLFRIIFLITGGTGLILIGIFRIRIPAGRWLLAVFLILLSIKLITRNIQSGISWQLYDRFPEDTLMIGSFPVDDVDVMFRSGTVVVNPAIAETGNGEITLNTVFASADLVIPDSLNVEVLVDAVFSSCEFPDGQTLHFGSQDFINITDTTGKIIRIRTDVIFGTLRVRLVR